MKDERQIPSKIKKYLDEIAERLWMQPSHACAMVGAGFSINAIKSDSSVSNPPTWSKLADLMLDKLYDKSSRPNTEYLDVLNIADEFQASKGMGEMNRFIEDSIPDKKLFPSELHKKFMSLPWADVLTTNYDTLLERAADLIVDRNYERVVSKEKLVLSHSPRIIKLHGSFPSNPPYVISSEDYRRYPIDNAILVNTVQQSLIENTLCLFGFSGDDPNFLKWIGWIRDNLGDNMPRIYLIGYFNCQDSKLKLLDKRRIIMVDLAPMCKSSDDIYNALMDVVSYLHETHSAPEKWGTRGIPIGGIHNKGITAQSLIKCLKQQRESYPGWKIVPYQKRRRIMDQLYYFPHVIWQDIKAPYDIQLLYEYNDLFEKASLSIPMDDVDRYRDILSRYFPFENIDGKAEEGVLTQKNHSQWDWSEIQQMWLYLHMALLRFYRETGMQNEWKNEYDILYTRRNRLKADTIAELYYELCLHDIYMFELHLLEEHVKEWGMYPLSPFWKAKMASLIAEFFDISEAQNILEDALREERESQNLVPVNSDYNFVSVESVILLLIERIRFSKSVYVTKSQSRADYSERMKELCQYDCDPAGELIYFEHCIRPVKDINNENRKAAFDLGRITTSFTLGQPSKDYFLAQQYIRVIEDMGYPMHLPLVNTVDKESITIALANISDTYPWVVNATLFRLGSKDIVHEIWTRKYLNHKSRNEVDDILKRYIGCCNYILSDSVQASDQRKAYYSILPEIMSRLVTKASFEVRHELLSVIGRFFSTPLNLQINGLEILVKRLIESFSIQEQGNLLAELFAMPFPKYNSNPHFLWKQEPFNYLSLNIDSARIKLDAMRVNQVINMLYGSKVERFLAFDRLQFVCRKTLLTPKQEEAFSKALWSTTNAYGFPEGLELYTYSVYALLPHPAYINPQELLCKYFSVTPLFGKNTSISRGYNEISYHNVINVSDDHYSWSAEEVRNITDDILVWWDSIKSKRMPDNVPVVLLDNYMDNIEEGIRYIIKILHFTIIPNVHLLDDDHKERLKRMAQEAENKTPYSLPLQVVIEDASQKVEQEICDWLYSNDEKEVIAACLSFNYIRSKKSNMEQSVVDTLAIAFGMNKEKGKLHIIETISDLLGDKYGLTYYQLNNILIGLSVNRVVLEINDDDSELVAEEKLLIKTECTRIAYRLRQYYKNQIHTRLEILDAWLNGELMRDEFWEICNVLSE